MRNEVTLLFGDGEYLFKYGMRQIAAIEDKAGAIGSVYSRLLKGRYVQLDGMGFGIPGEASFGIADIVEVIRQGLIGGASGVADGAPVAVTALTANRLIDTYVMGEPLQKAWDTATAALSACIEGYASPPTIEEQQGIDPKKKRTRSRSNGVRSSPTVP